MSRLATIVVARRRRVLVCWAAAVVACAALGTGLHEKLANRGYSVPGSESERVAHIERQASPGGEGTDVFVAVTLGAGARADAVLRRVRAALRGPSYVLGTGRPLGTDGSRVVVLPVRLSLDDASAQKKIPELRRELRRTAGERADLELLGQAAVFERYSTIARDDLARAEAIGLPVTLAILVVAFLSLVAAGVPLLLGLVVLATTFGALYVLATATDLSVFVTNTALLLGLGLSIDFSLFMTTRFREALRRDPSLGTDQAIVEAMRTTGRAIVFSGLTVAASLASLFLVGVGIFSSMAIGATLATLLAVAAALTLVPAILSYLGPRIDSLPLKRASAAATRAGVWHVLARVTTRRSLACVLGTVAFLLLLAAPVGRLELDLRSTGALPSSDGVRTAADRVAAELGPGVAAPVTIATTRPSVTLAETRRATNVDRVLPPVRGEDGWTFVTAILDIPPDTDQARTAVQRLRERLDRVPGHAFVGGPTAETLDIERRISARTPLVVGAALACAFVLLTWAFRSLLVPLVAVVTTTLSVAATLGAISWIYQTVLGEPGLGYFVPLFVFAIVFGLSVDYEVFLVSRIRESYRATGDHAKSIGVALVRSGRPITVAGLVVISVFLAFAASRLLPFNQLGLAMALAVLLDVTLVRCVLVPAALALFGSASWWLPQPNVAILNRLRRSRPEPTSPTGGG